MTKENEDKLREQQNMAQEKRLQVTELAEGEHPWAGIEGSQIPDPTTTGTETGEVFTGQPKPEETLEYWQQQYGRSENKVGELRKQLEEAEERAKMMEEARNQSQQTTAQPEVQQQQQQNFDWLQGLPDDSLYDPQNLRQGINNALNMLATGVSAQYESVKSRASNKNWDISSEEEASIRQRDAHVLSRMFPKEQDDYIFRQVHADRLMKEKPEVEKVKEQAKKTSEMVANRAFVESSSDSVGDEPKSALDVLTKKFESGELNSEQMKKELKKLNLYQVSEHRRRF